MDMLDELEVAESAGFLEESPDAARTSPPPDHAPPSGRMVTLGPRAQTWHGSVAALSEADVTLEILDPVELASGTDVLVQLDEVPEALAPVAGPTMVLGTFQQAPRSASGTYQCHVRLLRPLSKQVERPSRKHHGRVWAVPLAIVVLLLIAFAKYFNYLWFWYDPVFQTYSLCVAVYIFTRAFLSLYYRAPKDGSHTPTGTVVIAVKNEEENIAPTIDHCFRSDYPPGLLDVIVIDDGSTDKTWEVLREACKRHPALTIYRFAKNKGKRHAMALGALKARGEIIIYVDSDSFVERPAIKRIVQPFANAAIGAVAGHIQVIVNPTQILSKMERVRYFISHRVIKACESLFGAVTCCSGAFSAYRRTAVLRVLPAWFNQTFLGTRATFGDDRSLTNHILREYQVIFHDGAVCWTYVPDAWPKFFRQQLRWKKSWTRETIAASRIMWRKHPVAAFSYYLGVLMTLVAPLVVLRAIVFMPLTTTASASPYLIGLLLVYFFFCLIFRFHTGSRYWLHGLGFAALYIGVLCWQNYYAMLTVNRTHWGTR